MKQVFLLLVFVICHGISNGQVSPPGRDAGQQPESVVTIPDEIQQFKRSVDIYLNYDNYVISLLQSGIPVRVFCSHYHNQGNLASEPAFCYYLYDRYLHHLEFEQGRGIFYSRERSLMEPYVKNTELEVLFPELPGNRLNSGIRTGIWYPTHRNTNTEFTIPINFSLSYLFYR